VPEVTQDPDGSAGPPPVRVAHGPYVALFDPDSARGPSIGTYLRRGEFYEAQMLEHIRSLRIMGNYVDAGAAIGTHTIFFAVVCGADHVDAFEPRARAFELLQRNISLNGLTERVTAHEVGLGRGDSAVTVELDGQPCTFRTRRLDDTARRPVAVLKIDVEDMETDVVAGARRVLSDDHPRVFAEARSPELYVALKAALAAVGYRPTGRVFNSTPTYEFVASPWPNRLGYRLRSALRKLTARSAMADRVVGGLRRTISSRRRRRGPTPGR